MTPHIPEGFSTRLIDWSPFMIMGQHDGRPEILRKTTRDEDAEGRGTAPTNRRSWREPDED